MHCVIAEFLQNGQDECWVEIPRRFAPRNDIKESVGLTRNDINRDWRIGAVPSAKR